MKIAKIVSALSIVFVITYCLLDRNLFYYGKSDFKYYNLLPLKIIPDYTAKWEYGFTLRDQYGFTVAAKGNTYSFNNKTVSISEVLKYGFSNNQLVAIVSDSSRVIYCLKFAPTPKGRTDFDGVMYSGSKINDFKLDRWVDIDDNYIGNLSSYRNRAMLISLILIITLLYILIKQIVKKSSRALSKT
ncbi:MAG: hypothetical protein ABI166_05740 [Mucilaginibacter sp.]